MIHTLELVKNIDYDDYKDIDNVLFRVTKKKAHINRTQYKNLDIRSTTFKALDNCPVELKIKKFKNEYVTRYRFIMIVNPMKILYNDFINTADEHSTLMALKRIDECFSAIGLNHRCAEFYVHRIDYSYNYKFENSVCVEKYLKLLKKGSIPVGFTVHKVYDKISHRKSEYKTSLYCYNGSVVINIYDKHAQILSYDKCDNPDDAIGILRFEVQCQAPKINTIKSKYSIPDKNVFNYISEAHSQAALHYYLHKLCGAGDYYTYDTARERAINSGLNDRQITIMLELLKAVNAKKLGLDRGKDYLISKEYSESNIAEALSNFDSIGVNPVTIPVKWKIEKFDNPVKLLFD